MPLSLVLATPSSPADALRAALIALVLGADESEEVVPVAAFRYIFKRPLE